MKILKRTYKEIEVKCWCCNGEYIGDHDDDDIWFSKRHDNIEFKVSKLNKSSPDKYLCEVCGGYIRLIMKRERRNHKIKKENKCVPINKS